MSDHRLIRRGWAPPQGAPGGTGPSDPPAAQVPRTVTEYDCDRPGAGALSSITPSGIECRPDAGFCEWLAASGGSLLISTYQAGHLMHVGHDGRNVTFLSRQFVRPMGIDVNGGRLALAALQNIWVFDDAPKLAPMMGASGALYLPALRRSVGPLKRDYHDVQIAAADTVYLTSTKCSQLERLSVAANELSPYWAPPWVTPGTPEDRCHLNGFAIANGAPAFATALGRTNEPNGWRPGRHNGGLLMRIPSGETIAEGLCMPHSPRWHDGALWVLDSGRGRLLRVSDTIDEVVELPAFLRGLTFANGCALVGLCQIRERSDTFVGSPVAQKYPRLMCGLAVVDLARGTCVGVLQLGGICTEIYDVRFLPGVRSVNLLQLWGAG